MTSEELGSKAASPELTVQWWKKALETPTSHNLLVDQTGQNASTNQEGEVWFLYGTIGGSVKREITIPGGKSLLIPIINAECSQAEFDCELETNTLRTRTQELIDGIVMKQVLIDDIDLVSRSTRVQSEEFQINFPADNIYKMIYGIVNATVSSAFSDGYWLLLEPLPKGTHMIEFGGEIMTKDNFLFKTHAEYKVTIED